MGKFMLDAFGDNCNFHFGSKSSYDYRKDFCTDKVSEDVIDLLPSDPFSMDIGAEFQVIIDWIGEFRDDFCPNKASDCLGDMCNVSLESGKDYSNKVSEDYVDIVDLLPSDPFSMDINAKVKAFIDWFEELDGDLGLETLGFGVNETDFKNGDDDVYIGFNLIWKESTRFESKPVGSSTNDYYFSLDQELEELMGFSYEKYCVYSNTRANNEEDKECTVSCMGVDVGDDPHEGLYYALGYLGTKDLLSVERVCKSLKDVVQNDLLLWKCIHIDKPLSDKIRDDDLVKLANRAQGNLQKLSLFQCFKISDNGLKQVLERNPKITMLSVPGCVRMSIDGILANLKIFSSAGKSQIKRLRTGGMHNLTTQHLEELKCLLGATAYTQQRPRYYVGPHLYLSLDDDRPIDIDTCPLCDKVRQVYDCPVDSCKHCRGCSICIARCINCGCCINGRASEETFCLDLICLTCWKFLNNPEI